jgi:hypothetical protein
MQTSLKMNILTSSLQISSEALDKRCKGRAYTSSEDGNYNRPSPVWWKKSPHSKFGSACPTGIQGWKRHMSQHLLCMVSGLRLIIYAFPSTDSKFWQRERQVTRLSGSSQSSHGGFLCMLYVVRKQELKWQSLTLTKKRIMYQALNPVRLPRLR